MNVEDVIRIRIAEAARKIEAARRRRAELDTARQRGVAQRHAAKLRAQASRQREASAPPPEQAPDPPPLAPPPAVTRRLKPPAANTAPHRKENPSDPQP